MGLVGAVCFAGFMTQALFDPLPFEGDDRLAVGLRRAHEDAPSLRTRLRDAPEPLVQLVDSLLVRDPERRPDASTVAAALAGPPQGPGGAQAAPRTNTPPAPESAEAKAGGGGGEE